MNDINKVSDIKVEDVLEYLRIDDPTDKLVSEMRVHLKDAKEIVKVRGYFFDDEELDQAKAMVSAVYLECARLYGNKDPDDSVGKENPTLKSLYDSQKPLSYSYKPPKEEEEE